MDWDGFEMIKNIPTGDNRNVLRADEDFPVSDCGHVCCDERDDPNHDHSLDPADCASCHFWVGGNMSGSDRNEA